MHKQTTINEAKQKMGRTAAETIAKELQLKNWDGHKANCHFHSENTPSFKWCDEDKSGGNNYFKCFGCGKRYDIIDHYMNFENKTYQQAIQKLCESQGCEYTPPPKSKDEYFKGYHYPVEVDCENRKRAEKYLLKRHISLNTMNYANIKEDAEGNIVFEYRDTNNVLLNVKYRQPNAIKKGQTKMWFQKGSSNCPSLFMKQKIDTSKPLIICEGEIDCLSVIESGETNTVSVPFGSQGMDWIDFNWEWLESIEKIIIWADDDVPGKKMTDECISRLGNFRCYIVKIPEEIKKQLQEAKDKKIISNDCGDANNILITCGKNAVISLINSAEGVPSKRLKDLMRDVEEVDVQSLPRITTGYKELDKRIYGNFLPCFNIITGYTGAGKSTVSTQMSIISPIENGHKVMVFSGELSDGQLKSWIMKPLAGRNHMVVWKNKGQPDGYSVSFQAKQAINKFYEDKIRYYDDDEDFDTSARTLLEEMEYAYKRHGVKFFLIDNLMCVDLVGISKDESSEWALQKMFIKKLLMFTNKYGVNTTLIIHPKKPNQHKERNAYELHGASEVGNFCHRLFWVVQLIDDKDGCAAQIELLKDRPGSKQGSKCRFYYDPPTMRLYSDEEELNKRYSWEQGFNPNYPVDLIPRLVVNQVDETKEVLG